jgi:hypothetical protein
MLPVDLVIPVGQQQDRRQPRHPADQVTEHIQGGLVGPVHVLHGQHRGVPRPAQLRTQRLQQPVAVPAVLQGPGQAGADAADEVTERAEGTAGGEVVAVPDQEPALGGQDPPGRLDQARLADPGLPGDEHHRARTGRGFPRRRG